MKTHLLTRTSLLVAALGLSVQAAPLTFDFKDPKGVNNVQFSLDAPLESITGSVTFDPAQPAATKGKITLDTKSLTVGNPMMADHLRGENWLDVAKHPAITFEAVSLSNVRTQGNVVTADVAGKLTLKGVTKDIKVPVSFTHLPDKLGARVNDPKVKGDLLVLRANFAINRADFGIQAGKNTDKVAETIQLSLSIAGAAPKS